MKVIRNIQKALPRRRPYPPRFRRLKLFDMEYRNSYKDADELNLIKEGYKINPVVRNIIDLISNAAVQAKWKVKDKNTEQYCSIPLLNEPGFDGKNEVPALLDQPNVDQAWGKFMRDCINELLLTGNLFITGETGTGILKDQISYIYTIPSLGVEVYKNYYKVNQGDFRNRSSEIPANMVCNIRYPNPDYDHQQAFLFGISPLRAAHMSINTLNASLELGYSLMQNRGANKIIYPDTETEIDEDQAKDLKKKLSEGVEGIPNVGKIAISNMKLGVLDLNISSKDVLMLEQRNQAAAEICHVMNVPVQLLGQNVQGESSFRDAQAMMWRNAVIPILDTIKDGLNRWLMPSYGYKYKLEYDLSHIQAIIHDRLALGKSIQTIEKFITFNEARALVGLPMRDDGYGDKYLSSDAEMANRVLNVPMEEADQQELEYQDEYNTNRRDENSNTMLNKYFNSLGY